MYVKDKIVFFSTIMLILISLTGCDNTERTKTFTNKINHVEITTTFIYKGDKVLKQISKNKIYYSDTVDKTKEALVKTLEPEQQKLQKIKGVEDSITYYDTYAEETVTMNIDELDFDMLNKLTGITRTGSKGTGISMKKMQKYFEASGFTEVK
ncbi:TPA: YehR family lipoprotein [Klebsiella oxytoca]